MSWFPSDGGFSFLHFDGPLIDIVDPAWQKDRLPVQDIFFFEGLDSSGEEDFVVLPSKAKRQAKREKLHRLLAPAPWTDLGLDRHLKQ